MKENKTQKLIEKLKKLSSIGVDVSKIQSKDTIKTLALKSEISEEAIIEIGLNPEDKIGQNEASIASSYRGKKRGIPPSEEEKKILEELGIGLEREKRPKGRAVQVFIEDIKKLKSIGVDVSKIQSKDTITTLALKSGISEKAIIAIGLNPNDKVGQTRASIAGASRGVGCMTQPTQEEKKILQELGISLERKKKARTGKEIAKASIQALTNIEILEQEEQVLKDLLKREKEEALNKDE